MVGRPAWPCAVLLAGGRDRAARGGARRCTRRSRRARQRGVRRRARPARSQQDEVPRRDRRADRRRARSEARPALAARCARCSRPRWATSCAGAGASPREFHAGAAAMHRALFDDARRQTLRLPGAGAELRAAVASRSASAAALLARATRRCSTSAAAGLETALRRCRPDRARLASLAPLALVAAALLLVAAALRAPTRRRGLRRAALGLALAGGVHRRGDRDRPRDRPLDLRHQPRRRRRRHDLERVPRRPAALGRWSSGAVGLIAAAVFEPGAPGAWRRGLRRMLSPSGSPARLVRAGALALLAALLLWMPEVPLDLALVTGRRCCSSSRPSPRSCGSPPLDNTATVGRHRP